MPMARLARTMRARRRLQGIGDEEESLLPPSLATGVWLMPTTCGRWRQYRTPLVREYIYDAHRAKQKSSDQALRAVAHRLVASWRGCLKFRALYDELVAWPSKAEPEKVAAWHPQTPLST